MAEDGYRAGSVAADAEKWQTVADLPRFVELMGSRRRFVVSALMAFSAYTLAFLLVCGYAPGFMEREDRERVHGRHGRGSGLPAADLGAGLGILAPV